MGVIEHFEDGPLPALKEAYRLLKPDGLIFVSVPTVNIMRRFVRRPCRTLINALRMSFKTLRSNWGRSKRGALLAAAVTMAGILPERIVRIIIRIFFGQKSRYYHFLEYRYSISEVQNFLKESGFEIIKTVPHDLYGAKGHAAGLVVDFPFLAARNGVNFRLNPCGTLISQMFLKMSPWIACSSVLCVGKSLKKAS
jgi:SAM-dependent methyltransferase